MVNLTRLLMMPRHPKNHSPDGFWRRRQVLKLCGHFYGRGRNCFSIAIRRLQKSLLYVAVGRKLRKINIQNIWEGRITAGCQELGNMPEGSKTMLESLARCNVQLNRQSLANLAIWEPRTFEAINKIAAVKAQKEKTARYLGPFPKGILGKL